MILDRYLVKEVAPNVGLGLMVFTFVLLMNQILLLAELLITRGVEFIKIFLIIFYLLPAFTVLTIPMSLLLGVLLAMGRLNGDSELTVMRASGISVYRLLIPVFLVGILCWGICSYLIQVTVPWANYSLNKMMFRIMTTNATSELKPRVFYNDIPHMILYVEDIPSAAGNWKGVFIFDESQQKPRTVLAKEGYIQKKGDQGQVDLDLRSGSWHEVEPRQPQDYTYVYFLQDVFPLTSANQNISSDIPKGDRDQTIKELKQEIKEYKAKKLPTAFLEVEIHKKYAIPFACMVFAFLAMTLGFTSKKGGRSSAYAVSIGIILVYYIFLIGGERLGDAGTVPPWLAAWGGNIALGAFGLLIFIQSNSTLFVKLAQQVKRPTTKELETQGAVAGRQAKRIRIVIRIQRFPFRLFTLLDKYIIQEFLKKYFLILIALVLIAEMIEATQLVDDLLRNKVGGIVLFEFLKFHFPQWVFYVLPVSSLTTTLVTFGILTKNSEIIAMKSSGISLYRISLPVIALGLVLSACAFWLQDYILPYTNKIANNYKHQLRGDPPETWAAFERRWISASDGFYNYDLFDTGKNIWYGFSVYKVDMENFELQKRIYARSATYEKGKWVLKQGWDRTFDTAGRVKYHPFKEDTEEFPVKPDSFRGSVELPAEMTTIELSKYIQEMKQRGYDFVRFAVDLQAKFSFPLVTLILTLIAVPFSFTTGKRGALYGIGLSIVVGIVFWFFLALTKSLGYLEILDPFLAAWTPNIIATMAALYLLFKLRT